MMLPGNMYVPPETPAVAVGVNTGGSVRVSGGGVIGANGLLDISAALPSTLTGNYTMQSNAASAAVESAR